MAYNEPKPLEEVAEDPGPTILVFGRAESQIGIARTSSEGTILGADLLGRPLSRPGELLEVVPGMIAAQHSGSGKANQYFLRGFNLDHGSDFTAYIDGVQMNLRSHGHGHGYLDLNGLIMATVRREDYKKGPYDSSVGDFALAGAIKIFSVDEVDRPWVTAEIGGYNNAALGLGGSVRVHDGKVLTFVGDAKVYDGPWAEPERLRHLAAFMKYLGPLGRGSYAISMNAYRATWRPTEQVPERIIGSNLCLNEFCSPDPTSSGYTTRFIGNLQYESVRWQGNIYVQRYSWAMSSNPTYAKADGTSAQIIQTDKRWVIGLRLEGESDPESRLYWAYGTEQRFDDIGEVGVAASQKGQVSNSLGLYRIQQASGSIWSDARWSPVAPLRLFAGLRGDLYRFSGKALDPEAKALGEGSGGKGILSPKIGAALSAAPRLEFYANWGKGFHSNDIRGVVSGDSARLFAAGRGYEIGSRIHWGQLNVAATYWWLRLGSELRFSGDSNTVEPTGASRRQGMELVGFWRPFSWLAIDASFTQSHSRYVSGEYIPNAFENAGQIGFSLVSRDFDISLRWRHLGPYPLDEANEIRDGGSNIVNMRAVLKRGRLELQGEIINLFQSRDKDIVYLYESFIPGFDNAPVEGRLSRPMEPRTLRIGTKFKF